MATFNINVNSKSNDNNNVYDVITPGENMTEGTICYLNTDGKYYKANASTKATSVTELRITRENVVADQLTQSLVRGYHEFSAGSFLPFVIGMRYYVSTTPGEATITLYEDTVNVIRYIGTATDPNTLYFNPDHVFVSDEGQEVMDVLIKPRLNSDTQDGVVVAGGSFPSKIWATDGAGVPSWRDSVAAQGGLAILDQDTPSAIWVFAHGLGHQNPHVQIWNSKNLNGEVEIPEKIIAISDSIIQIEFPSPVSGRATAMLGGYATTVNSLIVTNTAIDVTAVDGNVIFADTTGGDVTVTLPAASASGNFRVYIKKVDASNNKVIISPDGSDTIEGNTSIEIIDEWEAFTLICNGVSAWYIV